MILSLLRKRLHMELKRIEHKLTVCKVAEVSNINIDAPFYFISKTDEELSLVCRTEDMPQNIVERFSVWRVYNSIKCNYIATIVLANTICKKWVGVMKAVKENKRTYRQIKSLKDIPRAELGVGAYDPLWDFLGICFLFAFFIFALAIWESDGHVSAKTKAITVILFVLAVYLLFLKNAVR